MFLKKIVAFPWTGEKLCRFCWSRVAQSNSILVNCSPKIIQDLKSAEKSNMDERLATIALAIGALTIALNIVQLWCLHKYFRRHVNPLMVIIFHLSVADLVQDMLAIATFVIILLERKVFVVSFMLHQCIDVCVEANKYLASVSIVTLATLTVLKMLRVTQNAWLTKSTIKRICRRIWIVVSVCFLAEFLVYKVHGYSTDAVLVSSLIVA